MVFESSRWHSRWMGVLPVNPCERRTEDQHNWKLTSCQNKMVHSAHGADSHLVAMQRE